MLKVVYVEYALVGLRADEEWCWPAGVGWYARRAIANGL